MGLAIILPFMLGHQLTFSSFKSHLYEYCFKISWAQLPTKQGRCFFPSRHPVYLTIIIFVLLLLCSSSLRYRYCHTYIDAYTYILYMSIENEQSIVIFFCSAFLALMNFCDNICVLHKEGLWMRDESYTYL